MDFLQSRLFLKSGPSLNKLQLPYYSIQIVRPYGFPQIIHNLAMDFLVLLLINRIP